MELSRCWAGYFWSQSPQEVTLRVLVPPGTKGKDVTVRATKWTLSVRVKVNNSGSGSGSGSGGDGTATMLEGDLCYPISVEGEIGSQADPSAAGFTGGGGGAGFGGGGVVAGLATAGRGNGVEAELDWELKDATDSRWEETDNNNKKNKKNGNTSNGNNGHDNVSSAAAPAVGGAVASAGPLKRRLLCVTLPKLAPAPSVVVWWQAVIKGHPNR